MEKGDISEESSTYHIYPALNWNREVVEFFLSWNIEVIEWQKKAWCNVFFSTPLHFSSLLFGWAWKEVGIDFQWGTVPSSIELHF